MSTAAVPGFSWKISQVPDVQYKIVLHLMPSSFAFWWCSHVPVCCEHPDFDRLVLLGPASRSVPSGGVWEGEGAALALQGSERTHPLPPSERSVLTCYEGSRNLPKRWSW